MQINFFIQGGTTIGLDMTYAQAEALVFDGVDPNVAGLTVDPASPPTWIEFGPSLSQQVGGTAKLKLSEVIYISET